MYDSHLLVKKSRKEISRLWRRPPAHRPAFAPKSAREAVILAKITGHEAIERSRESATAGEKLARDHINTIASTGAIGIYAP
jgi:hypothetical protein